MKGDCLWDEQRFLPPQETIRAPGPALWRGPKGDCLWDSISLKQSPFTRVPQCRGDTLWDEQRFLPPQDHHGDLGGTVARV